MGSESVLQQEESNSIHNTAISEKEKYEVNVNKMFNYQFSLIFSEWCCISVWLKYAKIYLHIY